MSYLDYKFEFNSSFGMNKSHFNPTMKKNLLQFITKLEKIKVKFSTLSFDKFDFSFLTKNDLVYCDPPYLISEGVYNRNRGFKGWGVSEEILLLKKLDYLNSENIKFTLSNVIKHKGKTNELLINWLKKNNYNIYYLTKNYTNSNYNNYDCYNKDYVDYSNYPVK